MLVIAVRYVLPGVLVLIGFVLLFAGGGDRGLEGWALFVGAGLSVFVFGWLLRFGFDDDRDEEERAREFFDEHGYWPDEAPGREAAPPGPR